MSDFPLGTKAGGLGPAAAVGRITNDTTIAKRAIKAAFAHMCMSHSHRRRQVSTCDLLLIPLVVGKVAQIHQLIVSLFLPFFKTSQRHSGTLITTSPYMLISEE